MTSARLQYDVDHLSPQGLEEISRLLVKEPNRRIGSAVVDGRTVWIKRLGAEGRPFFKRLHALISPLLPWPMLRSSKAHGPNEMALRETSKATTFAEAGFPAVHVLLQQGSNLVLSNASTIVQHKLSRLRDVDAQAHDDLLVNCTAALAKAHRAGLCHGRPHPRDMILENGQLGFLDFEEAPEEVMPLPDAQARDVWLLFLQICGQALHVDTPHRALDAYRADAPAEVIPRLASARNLFAVLVPVLRALRPIGLGSDGMRLLKASEFLYPALAQNSDQIVSGALPDQKTKAMQ